MQSGLVLLSQSTDKLSEVVRQSQQSSLFVCCTSSFLGLQALVLPAEDAASSQRHSLPSSGAASAAGAPKEGVDPRRREAREHVEEVAGGPRPEKGSFPAMFLSNGNKKKGYENIAARGNQLFSIEGHEDDEEEDI